MKFHIEWHKKCLYNSEKSLEDKKIRLARMQEVVKKDADSVAFYRHQIACAEASGKEAFDADRYRVSHK